MLALSNIIWKKGKSELIDFLRILESCNIKFLELALNCLWEDPTIIPISEILWIRDLLMSFDIRCISVHSLTYNRKDLKLFDTLQKRIELEDYIKRYLEIMEILHCKTIVFGSPTSREIHGRSIQKCNEVFKAFLHRIDSELHNDTWFLLEPLPASICEFINTCEEGVKLIKNGGFKNIYINLDTKTIIENRENINNIKNDMKYFKHCHINNPGLKPPGGLYKSFHHRFAQMLFNIGYKGYISMEVLLHKKNQNKEYIMKMIRNCFDIYSYNMG